jgi:hypothetical protein
MRRSILEDDLMAMAERQRAAERRTEEDFLATALADIPRCLAAGKPVINCPSPLHVLKDTYDHSCY